jgi:hypothetical protein
MEESGIEANLGPAPQLGTTSLHVENRKRRKVSKACESCRMYVFLFTTQRIEAYLLNPMVPFSL